MFSQFYLREIRIYWHMFVDIKAAWVIFWKQYIVFTIVLISPEPLEAKIAKTTAIFWPCIVIVSY